MNTFLFDQGLPPYFGRDRKAQFSTFVLDARQKVMSLDYILFYRKTGTTEWPNELINSISSLEINPVSGEPNFLAGQNLTLKVTNTTLVDKNTGEVVVNPSDPSTVVGEFDFFQDVLCDFQKASFVLSTVFAGATSYGLHQFAQFALIRAISQGRLN